MSEAASTVTGLPQRPRLEREWRHGLRCLLRFATTPSDLANSFEAMLALAGPLVDREFCRFAAHPIGARLLAAEPREDLNALLVDRAALAHMPKGSLADAYLIYLGGEDMGSADYFLQAANLDEKAKRFGWSDDHLWFVRRMTNSHDIFHILAGYDRDVIGEVGVVAYTAGQIPLLPLRLLLPFFASLKPSQPVAWLRFLRDAYRHGKSTPSLACVDYTAMLPMPLDQVRQAIGVPSMALAPPRGRPEAGRALRGIERRVALV
jgi:ubiquinone biosynthesis protein COQ4